MDQHKIDSILEEAEINQKTGRFTEAAKHFEYLAREMFEHNYFIDMIYFFYRSIIARKNSDDITKIVRNLHTLGLNALKASTLIVSKNISKTIQYDKKTDLLWIAQLNLKYLGEDKKRGIFIDHLTQLYSKFASDESFTLEERKSFLEKNLEMLNDAKDLQKYKENKEHLAELVEEQAIQTLRSQGFDTELVSARLFAESATKFFEIDKMDKYHELIRKAKALDPKIKIKTPSKNQIQITLAN